MALKLKDLEHLPQMAYGEAVRRPRAFEIAELTWRPPELRRVSRSRGSTKSIMYVAGICNFAAEPLNPPTCLVHFESIGDCNDLSQASITPLRDFVSYRRVSPV